VSLFGHARPATVVADDTNAFPMGASQSSSQPWLIDPVEVLRAMFGPCTAYRGCC
jgi:hypothetical protein